MEILITRSNNELYHHGVKGMKWGVRKKRVESNITASPSKNKQNDAESEARRKAKIKKAVKVGAAAAATGLAVYGAYKMSKAIKDKNMRIAAAKGYSASEKLFRQSAERAMEAAKNNKYVTEKTMTSASPAKAVLASRAASRDNIVKATKNVLDYRRSGGDLKSLPRIEEYGHSPFLQGSTYKYRG